MLYYTYENFLNAFTYKLADGSVIIQLYYEFKRHIIHLIYETIKNIIFLNTNPILKY